MQVSYSTSVFTAAGWRNVTITAVVDHISAKMVTVRKVVAINGEEPKYGMSCSGAKRQSFNGKAIAEREVGAHKRMSACEVLEEATA
jgi:hypothetical protein